MAMRSINLGWAQVALGSASVIVVAGCYIASPALAISADLGVDLEAARLATLTDQGFLRLAGTFGTMGDPIITIGALAVGVNLQGAGSERRAHGFYWLAAVALLYTVYDAAAGFALPSAAAGGPATFNVIKPLIDALLCGASFGYGISGLLVGWPSRSEPAVGPSWLSFGLVLTGVLLVASSVATVAGFNGGLAIGIGLTVMTTLYTLLGLFNLRTPSRAGR